MGEATKKVEDKCALSGPRRKSCSSDHLVEGGLGVRPAAECDLEEIADTFDDAAVRVGVPRPLRLVRKGEPENPGEPAIKKTRENPSLLDARRQERLAKVKDEGGQPAWPGAPVQRHPVIVREMWMRQAEADQPEKEGSSLLGFWQGRATFSTCTSTGEAEPVMPRFPFLLGCSAESSLPAVRRITHFRRFPT